MIDTSSLNNAIQTLSYSLIPVLLGIILHEVAHGYVAFKKGDPTSKILGRLTINPIPHIDPMGLMTFILTAIASPFVFGWAKPIPVDTRNLRNPKKDMMWIAAAGPMANIALAIVFAILFKLLVLLIETVPSIGEFKSTLTFLLQMFRVGIIANVGLACINLIPIPPLDGSKILMGFMPNSMAYAYSSIERYGFIILLILLMTNILSKVLNPVIATIVTFIAKAVGL